MRCALRWVLGMTLAAAFAALAGAAGARLDRRPVLAGEFAAFLAKEAGARPASPAEAGAPAVLLNWHQARAYCAAQGKRLPTAPEWIEACRAGGMEFSGFIWEWTSTEAAGHGEGAGAPFKLLCGPGPECSCTHAYHPDWRNEVKGFRCARAEPSVRLNLGPSARP